MAAAACIPAALYLADLYDPQMMRNDRSYGSGTLKALGFAALAAAIFGLMARGGLPRGALIETIGVASIGVLLSRAVLVARLDERGHNRVLVIGAGQRATEIERIIRTEAFGEFEVAGTLDPSIDLSLPGAEPQKVAAAGGGSESVIAAPTLVAMEGGPEAVREMRVDTVVIASDERRARLPVDELIRLRHCGVTVLPAQRFAERVLRRIPLSLLRPSDLAIGEGLTSPLRAATKRVFDLVMSSILLICAAPVLLLLAALIKLESDGPVFYWQERVGRGGKTYRLHKLRTMRQDAEELSGPVWAKARDPRVTRLGALLRKTRLDEIPQVFAVFRGDMSFVGPRPERPFFVQQLKTQIPFFGLREAVKPGITGWAQIRYPYGATIEDARNKLEYDLYYVQHQSTFLDLTICFHTVKTVLFGRGAR